MEFEQLLGVGPSASHDELKRAYLQRLKEVNENDPNFENKLDRLSRAYKYLVRRLDSGERGNKVEEVKPITLKSLFENSFENSFGNSFLDSFFKVPSPFKSTGFDSFNKSFDDLETSESSEIPLSYYKYNTNFTSYDNNGLKQSKSVSRIEKIRDNNRYVSQVTRTQDGNKIVEEKLNPDGTITRTEKTFNQSLKS